MRTGKLTLVVFAAIFAAGAAIPCDGAQEATPATRTGQSSATLADGTTINAELNASIDSKKAKPGDRVVAHTTEAVKSLDDRTILPRGTKLVGHVTQAAARSKGDSESTLSISFDKAIVKGGEELPLNATIQALAAPMNTAVNGPDLDTTPRPSSPSNYPGGGNNSGMAGNRPGRPDGTTAYPGSSPRADDAGSRPGADDIAANQRGVYGMDGLRLTTATTNNTRVSVITAAGKNVHLDGGTRLLLVTQAVTSAAAGR